MHRLGCDDAVVEDRQIMLPHAASVDLSILKYARGDARVSLDIVRDVMLLNSSRDKTQKV